MLVDVREVSEYEAEFIAGAMLLPMSSFTPEFFPALPGQRVVLYCTMGKRSEAAAPASQPVHLRQILALGRCPIRLILPVQIPRHLCGLGRL